MFNHAELNLTNYKAALKDAKVDPKVGIKIAPLTNDQSFAVYVTEIPPSQKVGAHYHHSGLEVYGILSGSGVIHTAVPGQDNMPINIQSKSVMAGDFFNIQAGVIHQLENTGHEPLLLIFGCPASHLGDDRTITSDLC